MLIAGGGCPLSGGTQGFTLQVLFYKEGALCRSRRKVLFGSASGSLSSRTVGMRSPAAPVFAGIVSAGSLVFRRAAAPRVSGGPLLFWPSTEQGRLF